MKKKILLASDLDGTLLFFDIIKGKRVYRHSQEDAQAIDGFRKAGHCFALCTGRSPDSIFQVLSQFPSLHFDSLILSSGAALYQITSQSPLKTQLQEIHTISAELAEEALRFFYADGGYSLYWSTTQSSYGFADRKFITEMAFQPNLVPFAQWQPSEILGIGLNPYSQSASDTQRAMEIINKRWGGLLNCFRNKLHIDISPFGVDKGSGHARLSQILGGDYIRCAVGDAHNDIPMFQAAGKDCSYLMAGGFSELAPLARCTVKSVADCITQIRNLYEEGYND